MGSAGQSRPDVGVVRDYLKGVGKYLLGQLFGPDGIPWGTPLSVLEDLLAEVQTVLAVELLRQGLQRQADSFPHAPEPLHRCPGCGQRLRVDLPQPRSLTTRRGVVGWNEPACYCRGCRRACFPQSRSLGIDQSTFSTQALRSIVDTAVRAYSFAEAQQSLQRLADLHVLPKQVERIVHRLGAERLAERQAGVAAFQRLPLAQKYASPEGVQPPDLAVVMTDGGRLQIRSANDEADSDEANPDEAQPPSPPTGPNAAAAPDPSGESPGGSAGSTESPAGTALAEPSAEGRPSHWREDKIGLLLSMHSSPQPDDPCPQLPDCFADVQRIPRVARQLRQQARAASPGTFQRGTSDEAEPTVPLSAEPEPVLAEADPHRSYEPPQTQQRKVVASRQCWPEFGVLLAATAWSLGFQGANRKAFVGDGSSNNWEIQKRFFGSFVAVLDFLHALSYVYAAAMAGRSAADGWRIYRCWISQVWQGQVQRVIEALAKRQQEVGEPAKGESETSVPSVVRDALRYLRNNADKMDYPRYRQQGLPITSSLMESTVKQINRRVKGTEKFWSEAGAEAILQLRADQLSSDEPLEGFWERRQQQASGQRRYAGSTNPDRPRGARAPRKVAEQKITCPA